MAYTVASDTHAVGDTGHTTDHNNTVDVLTGMGAKYNVQNTAYAGGAVGDGVTDDTAAIQAALNATPAGATCLFPPPSVQYLVAGNIQVPPLIRLLSFGWQINTPVVKLKNASGAAAVFVSKGWWTGTSVVDSPVEIKDLTIDVNGANNASAHGILLMNYRSVVDHNLITNPGVSGIVFADVNQFYSTGVSYTATNASPCVVTATFANQVAGASVVFATGAPTGFTNGTTYFIVNPGVGGANTFNLAATAGGAAINSSSTGSGTLSANFLSNGAGENRVIRNTVRYTSPALTAGQYGIWVQDHGNPNPGSVTDGWLTANVVQGSGDFAFRLERAAGWEGTGNKTYFCQGSGHYLANVYGTFWHDNVADIGNSVAAGVATYYGYDFETLVGSPNRESFIHDNLAYAFEGLGNSNTTYHYYRLRNASGVSGTVAFHDNVATRSSTGTVAASVAWDFQPNGATLNVYEAQNIADGPSTTLPALTGTLNRVTPARTLYKQSASVTIGLSGVFGALTTFTPDSPNLSIMPWAVAIVWGGTFAGDTCQAQFVVTFDDGTTATITNPTIGSVTSTQTQSLTSSQLFNFLKDGHYITQVQCQAKTTNASTTVTCTAEVGGFNAN